MTAGLTNKQYIILVFTTAVVKVTLSTPSNHLKKADHDKKEIGTKFSTTAVVRPYYSCTTAVVVVRVPNLVG